MTSLLQKILWKRITFSGKSVCRWFMRYGGDHRGHWPHWKVLWNHVPCHQKVSIFHGMFADMTPPWFGISNSPIRQLWPVMAKLVLGGIVWVQWALRKMFSGPVQHIPANPLLVFTRFVSGKRFLSWRTKPWMDMSSFRHQDQFRASKFHGNNVDAGLYKCSRFSGWNECQCTCTWRKQCMYWPSETLSMIGWEDCCRMPWQSVCSWWQIMAWRKKSWKSAWRQKAMLAGLGKGEVILNGKTFEK